MPSISPGHVLSSASSITLKNFTIDDTDPSLKYSQGWQRGISSFASGGSFHAADGGGDVVTLNLPANTTAIYYFGFEQSSDATYQACIDCNSEGTGEVDNINAFINTPSKDPALLYQKSGLDPTVPHTFALVNVPSKNSGSNSVITLDSIVVTVDNDPVAADSSSLILSTTSIAPQSSAPIFVQLPLQTTSKQVPSSTASPTTSDPNSDDASGPTVSAVISSTSPSSSASGTVGKSQNNLNSNETAAQRAKSPFIITVSAILAVFILCILTYALMYFMRRRRRRRTAPKAPYMPIAEQTALFFSTVKKNSEKIGEASRDLARRSVAGFVGHGGGAGMRRLKDEPDIEPGRPKIPTTYGAVPAGYPRQPFPEPQRPVMNQVLGTPHMRNVPPPLLPGAFRQMPRSLHSPRNLSPGSGTGLSVPRGSPSPSGNISAGPNPLSSEGMLWPMPPSSISVPLPAKISGLPRSPRLADHPKSDPFATAEAEALSRGRKESLGPDMRQHRASAVSLGSVYTDGGRWERRYDFPRTPRSADRA